MVKTTLWSWKTEQRKGERIVIFLTLSIRRSYRVQFLSAKNRKLYLLFTHAHQNWTMEHWENFAWFNESVCCNKNVLQTTWKHGYILLFISSSGCWWCNVVGNSTLVPIKSHKVKPQATCVLLLTMSLYDHSVPIFRLLFPTGFWVMSQGTDHLKLVS